MSGYDGRILSITCLRRTPGTGRRSAKPVGIAALSFIILLTIDPATGPGTKPLGGRLFTAKISTSPSSAAGLALLTIADIVNKYLLFP